MKLIEIIIETRIIDDKSILKDNFTFHEKPKRANYILLA